jgi:hypothetical protein
MRNISRGGLLVLNSFSHRSPHEAPPHEGLLRWASVFGLPLGQSWAIEGAQEQVDWDTPVSRTPTRTTQRCQLDLLFDTDSLLRLKGVWSFCAVCIPDILFDYAMAS